MIDEVLFMEMRLFSEFCKRKKIPAKEANRLFKRLGIWEYIETCYDTLHTGSDELILEDIDLIIEKKGVIA